MIASVKNKSNSKPMHVFFFFFFLIFFYGLWNDTNEKNKMKKIITKRGEKNKTKQNKPTKGGEWRIVNQNQIWSISQTCPFVCDVWLEPIVLCKLDKQVRQQHIYVLRLQVIYQASLSLSLSFSNSRRLLTWFKG